MQSQSILAAVESQPKEVVSDLPLLRRTVRWVIEHEWVTTLDDLIERRLMLIFAQKLTKSMLQDLAECLVESGRLTCELIDSTVEATSRRLETHYGRVISS
jgi:glycerol-3-phosphate dehydrogenase